MTFLCYRALKFQGINSSLLNNLILNNGEEKNKYQVKDASLK